MAELPSPKPVRRKKAPVKTDDPPIPVSLAPAIPEPVLEAPTITQPVAVTLPVPLPQPPAPEPVLPGPMVEDPNPVEVGNLDLEVLVRELVGNADFNEILNTGGLDILGLDAEQRENAVSIALSCCINGPVGVNKVTTFPGFETETSIKGLFRCSNSQWKKFCRVVKPHIPQEVGGYMFTSFGGYWPDNTFGT
jgi:hypothetical protein